MTTHADSAELAERPLVAVYRGALMHYNEVYVRTEVESLSRYRSFYVGVRRVGEVQLPPERTLTLREQYTPIDRLLDPIVTRIGWRMEATGGLTTLGHSLALGSVVGRASQYAFQVHGVSPTLVRKLRALEPAVLHAYTGVSGAHALPLARRLHIPLVVTFNGYDSTATDEEMQQDVQYGRVFLHRRDAMKREVQLIITVSDFLRRKLVERGWPPEKITVLHSGIDTDLFTPKGAAPLAARAPIVFFAGRLIEKKGAAYLLLAMREVQNRIPNAELVIAGAGPLMAALQNQASELGLRVHFIGRATPEAIRACMTQAQVYCMPSVTASTGDSEGLPNALIEAMGAGLPVVASTSAGIPEAVIDGNTGFLVPERDVAALAARLIALLQDASLCEKMGAASRQRILTQFNVRTQVAQLEDLYDNVRHGYGTAGRRR